MNEPTSNGPLGLKGSRCSDCRNVAFPVTSGCQRCGGQSMEDVELSDRGTVWTCTVQHFAPKSPPYIPPAEGFTPFALGYVQLPEGVRVEAVLEPADLETLTGAEVRLGATEPVPRFRLANDVEGDKR